MQKRATVNTFLFFFAVFWAGALLVVSVLIYIGTGKAKKTTSEKPSVEKQSILNGNDVVIETSSTNPKTNQVLRQTKNYIWTIKPVKLIAAKSGSKEIYIKANGKRERFRFTPITKTVIIDQKVKKTIKGLSGINHLLVGTRISLMAFKTNRGLVKVYFIKDQ